MTSTAAMPGTTAAILTQLWELHERRGTMATLSKHQQAEIRQALRWIASQQATALYEAELVPYALGRVTQCIESDAIQLLQKADIRTLADFAASFGVPVEKPRRRR